MAPKSDQGNSNQEQDRHRVYCSLSTLMFFRLSLAAIVNNTSRAQMLNQLLISQLTEGDSWQAVLLRLKQAANLEGEEPSTYIKKKLMLSGSLDKLSIDLDKIDWDLQIASLAPNEDPIKEHDR